MSRMICAGLFGFGVALVMGCNSKPAGDPPSTPAKVEPNGEPKADPKGSPKTVTPGNGDPKVDPPPPKATHEMDPSKHAVPPGPVTGFIGGAEVTLTASVEGDDLVFQTTKPGPMGTVVPERRVSLKLITPTTPAFENRRLTINPMTSSGPGVPEVMIVTPAQPAPELYRNGYALTLELATRKGGKLAGKVYLSFPDEEKTFLAGTFNAEFPRQPAELPGPDDTPYVHGSVTVTGAAPTADLRVGYVAQPRPALLYFGAAELSLTPPKVDVPPEALGKFWWRQATEENSTRATTIGRDGTGTPFRYDHSHLTPGRHLVFAGVTNGPTVWKWVSVSEGGSVSLDLTLDATKTGKLEVIAPLEETKVVRLIPADEPGNPTPDATYGLTIAVHLRLEQPVLARRAVFPNLAPGKYEVRAGGQSRTVEVTAEKTAEVDFGKK